LVIDCKKTVIDTETTIFVSNAIDSNGVDKIADLIRLVVLDEGKAVFLSRLAVKNKPVCFGDFRLLWPSTLRWGSLGLKCDILNRDGS
jgi:hypothetical protein